MYMHKYIDLLARSSLFGLISFPEICAPSKLLPPDWILNLRASATKTRNPAENFPAKGQAISASDPLKGKSLEG
ncbi:hypothetical protein M8J77_005763 [Diaphorina citri]|nr:hypothetical protein M8J77_005763 [Diaphorina citri]